MEGKLVEKIVLYLFLFVYYLIGISVIPYSFIVYLLRPFAPNMIRKYFGNFITCLTQYIPAYLCTINHDNIYLYTDQDELHTPCIIMSNHQTSLDIIVVNILLAYYRILGCMRSLFKISLLFIPFLGFGTFERGFIPVTRSKKRGSGDIGIIKAIMNDLVKYADDFAYVIYPEGTRRDPDDVKKVEMNESQWKEYDILKATDWVLCPKYRGFKTIYSSCLSEPHVYDFTIMYKNHKKYNIDSNLFKAPYFEEYVMNKNVEVHIVIKKIPNDKISNDNTHNDLLSIFQEKDLIMSMFYNDPNEFNKHFKNKQKVKLPMPSILHFIYVSTVLFIYSLIGFKNILFTLVILQIFCFIKFFIEYKQYII